MILFKKEQEYLPMVMKAAQKYNVPPALLLGHIKQESAFNPLAKLDEPALKDASWGMMQLLVKTAKGLDPEASATKLIDPEYNIDLGAKYISQNLKRYNGNIQDAIAAYNAGSARKNDQGQYINSKGVPNVQNYVDKVYKNYVDYSKWLENGANLIDVSINPWLVAGFGAVLLLTIIGGGVYVGTRKRRSDRPSA